MFKEANPVQDEVPGRATHGLFAGKWLWASLGLAVLFAAYLLAGFYLVPGLVRSTATNWVRTNLDKPIALGEIKFNPLTFTLDVDEIALPDTRAPMVAVGHVRVGFSILSLFQKAYRFNQVTLDQPFVNAVIRPDGSLNLIELKPRTHSQGPNPAVKIDVLSVHDGHVVYADQSQTPVPEATLIPIAFTLKDFQTNVAEGGDFALNAKSERGEAFAWSGTLSISPISSRGRLTVAGLQSSTVQEFLGRRLPVALTGGHAGFTANYDFAYDAGNLTLNLSLPQVTAAGLALEGDKSILHGKVTVAGLDARVGPVLVAANAHGLSRLTAVVPKIALQGVGVATAGAAEPEIQLADAALTGTQLDFSARKIQLGSLVLNGANLSVARQHGGQISLMALLPPKSAAPAEAPPNAPAAQPWQIALGQFALNNARVDFEDRTLAHPARISLSPLTASATGAGSDLTQPVSLHFDTGINGKGHATGDATVVPESLAGSLKFNLTGLALRPFAGYLPPLKSLELRSGEASASGTVNFKGADIAALIFKGNAAVANFSMLETTTNSPLFAWRAFALKGIDVGKNHITINQASLARPLGQVVVLADRSFNFTPLVPPKAGATAAAPVQPAPASATVPIQAASAKPAWTIQVKKLNISGGSMNFADMSIQPNFSARIDELRGTIGNITNAAGQSAAIDLSGQVIDQFSPVTIKGSMDLLAYDRHTDMQLAFHNIELPVFNPYSGRYAGYAIAKGKLTTELSYKIDNRALKADHHVIIDQLEWGQATDSKEAVPLPIRFATALLKDSKGVIDLDLPVTGSLDDPKFSIWPIVWQVVGNVIEKAVTAPFRLIGSLFAGADKAQYIDFTPGSAVLPQGSAEALGALAKALNQRPQLKLDIPAGPGIREDATAVADAAIDKALLAKDAGKVASVAALDADDQHDRLVDLYRAKLGKKPALPDFPADALKTAPGAKPDASDDDRRTLLESQWLRTELRKSFTPSNAELAALGTARANAVRTALLADGSVDPARVFMSADATESADSGHSRMELKFE
ncbi:MAG TPA: DUF748 domain-containing protein [Rhizomicrobium sp.]|jgi:hypothetical protein